MQILWKIHFTESQLKNAYGCTHSSKTRELPKLHKKPSHTSDLVIQSSARVIMAEAAAIEEENRRLEAQSRVQTIPTTVQPETRSHHDAQIHQQKRSPSAQQSSQNHTPVSHQPEGQTIKEKQHKHPARKVSPDVRLATPPDQLKINNNDTQHS